MFIIATRLLQTCLAEVFLFMTMKFVCAKLASLIKEACLRVKLEWPLTDPAAQTQRINQCPVILWATSYTRLPLWGRKHIFPPLAEEWDGSVDT